MDLAVRRNAFGRQVDSFEVEGNLRRITAAIKTAHPDARIDGVDRGLEVEKAVLPVGDAAPNLDALVREDRVDVEPEPARGAGT